MHYRRKRAIFDPSTMSQTPHPHAHGGAQTEPAQHRPAQTTQRLSVLAWPAWLRVLAVLPVVVALWLAVAWANAGVDAW